MSALVALIIVLVLWLILISPDIKEYYLSKRKKTDSKKDVSLIMFVLTCGIMYIFFPILHEIGHIIPLFLFRVDVKKVNFFYPNPGVFINIDTIPNRTSYAIFLLGGLFLTLVTGVLLTKSLYHRRNNLWLISYMCILYSVPASLEDLLMFFSILKVQDITGFPNYVFFNNNGLIIISILWYIPVLIILLIFINKQIRMNERLNQS
jgi:hypothetical protein